VHAHAHVHAHVTCACACHVHVVHAHVTCACACTCSMLTCAYALIGCSFRRKTTDTTKHAGADHMAIAGKRHVCSCTCTCCTCTCTCTCTCSMLTCACGTRLLVTDLPQRRSLSPIAPLPAAAAPASCSTEWWVPPKRQEARQAQRPGRMIQWWAPEIGSGPGGRNPSAHPPLARRSEAR